jgi:hypothetical protein
MAALRAILTALRRVTGRDLMTLWSIKVNNFFLFVMLLVGGNLQSGLEPKSAEPLLLLLGMLVLLPASSDPMAKIPQSRLGLWPLRATQRVLLRLTSLLLSPVFWLAVVLLGKTARISVALGFVALAVAIQFVLAGASGLARVAPVWNPLRHVPQLPGRMGGLLRNNLREMFVLLDFYVAAALSVGGLCYVYLSKSPDGNAAQVISILIALALSTFTQSLFGFELGQGMTRYRLLPLRGWENLLAKDLAFLVVLVGLVGALSVGSGLAAGLVALALGHHSSIHQRIVLKKWRFAGGRLLPIGALQGVGTVAAGFEEIQYGVAVAAACAAFWLVSVYFYGRRLEAFVAEPN